MTGTFTPRPGAASAARMLRAQTGLELRLILRNGEQLLLTLVIPVVVLLAGARFTDVDRLVPGVLALAVLSTAFTGLAIGTGFERRYGALKRLGASPLPRSLLLASKALAVLGVEAVQWLLIATIGFELGWRPDPQPVAVLALAVVGTAALAALGLLMAGTLRAEATLAAANFVYLLLLAGGGIAIPSDRYPGWAGHVVDALPSGALAGGLRAAFSGGTPWWAVLVLALWGLVGGVAAARSFRWE